MQLPEKIYPRKDAKNAKASGCKAIAFTYSEPVVFYEYMYDIVQLAKDHGLKGVMISNGYIQEKPLTAIGNARRCARASRQRELAPTNNFEIPIH